MENLRKNWLLVLIGFATVVLSIIAIITAWRLYQLRRVPVAPTVPAPAPAVECAGEGEACYGLAGLPCCEGLVCVTEEGLPIQPDKGGICQLESSLKGPCTLDFCIPTPTPTPTATPTPTGTPTPTPTGTLTPTPTPTATGTPTPTSTPTPGPTATPTPTGTPAPTATPTPVAEATPTSAPVAEVELPEAGIALPTIGVILGGVLLIVTSLLIAL